MAKTLIPIPNQPLRFMDYDEAKFCQKDDSRCFLHQPGDPIKAQFKQFPCGENLICNPTFLAGSELTTNGNFDGNADGWTLQPGWAYDSNNVQFTGSGSGVLSQSVSITPGRVYILKFTVTDLVSGALYFDLGGGTPIAVAANGVYTFNITAAGINSLLAFASVSGSFDPAHLSNISLVEVSCWIDSGSSWVFDGTKACHTAGSNSFIYNSAILTQGKYYKIVVKVSGITAGTLAMIVCDTAADPITTNGTKTIYIDAGFSGTDIDFIPSIDFDGCIEAVEVYELKKDFTFSLLDMEGNLILTFQSYQDYIGYENEFVTLSIDGLDSITQSYIENPGPPPFTEIVPITIAYGCYQLLIEDSCAANYGYACNEPSDYLSNCIKYQESFAGTYLVVGNNNPTDSIKKYAFGFLFSSAFYLVQRLYIGFRKPKYPSKFDRNKYSNGVNYKSYVETEKVFELVFGAVTEIEHDVIALQINCKQFGFIKNECLYQYFNITEEYSPEWDAKGALKKAESRIEVVAIGDTLSSIDLPSVNDFILTEDERIIETEQGGGIIR